MPHLSACHWSLTCDSPSQPGPPRLCPATHVPSQNVLETRRDPQGPPQGWGWRERRAVLTLPAVSIPGEVFYSTSPERFTFQEAANECRRLGARLATTGQLYLAWQGGMDVCSAGWLADRSVRYPISKARPNCGGNLLGVRTVYLHANQTGYPDPSSRYDAICYTGAAGGRGRLSCFSRFKGPLDPQAPCVSDPRSRWFLRAKAEWPEAAV